MDEPKKNSQISRLLAVLALVAATVIVIVAISGATGGGDDDGEPQRAQPARQGNANQARPARRAYKVQEGDNLTIIAQKTGVPVDRLQRLNPNLDPQALQPDQRIKLR